MWPKGALKALGAWHLCKCGACFASPWLTLSTPLKWSCAFVLVPCWCRLFLLPGANETAKTKSRLFTNKTRATSQWGFTCKYGQATWEDTQLSARQPQIKYLFLRVSLSLYISWCPGRVYTEFTRISLIDNLEILTDTDIWLSSFRKILWKLLRG